MSEFNELVNIDIKNKHILLREDLNVPITNNQITNDKRIKAALPTIEYALSQGSKIAILSHLGRPKEGKYNKDYSLKPIALRLSELLGLKVYFEKEPLNIKPEPALINLSILLESQNLQQVKYLSFML